MKKFFSVALIIFTIFLSFCLYAQDTSPFIVIRNKIFNECREMRPLLERPKDIIIVNSMWSSAVMTVSQLDAYFHMIGIFNTISEKDLSEDAFNYITKWLEDIRNTNDLNIRSLEGISYSVEPVTKVSIERLKGYFKDLNELVRAELARIAMLKLSVINKQI